MCESRFYFPLGSAKSVQSAECRKLGPTLPEPSRARRNKGVGIHFHVRLEERRIPRDDGEKRANRGIAQGCTGSAQEKTRELTGRTLFTEESLKSESVLEVINTATKYHLRTTVIYGSLF